MNQIRKNLWVGDARTVEIKPVQMKNAGINAVLNVADDHANIRDANYNFTALQIPLKDEPHINPPWMLKAAVNALRMLIDNGKTVYVHCRLGINRAPTVCALYLSEVEGCTFDEAWAQVRKVRPEIYEQTHCKLPAQSNPVKGSNEFFYEFGKDIFGPAIVGYTQWLIEHANQYEKVLFQIRGGYILWELYNILKKDNSPEGLLFHASRRCVGNPAFPAYIRKMVGSSKTIATSDTGWWGNMQNTIARESGAKVQGFYLGSRCSTDEGKSGFLFERWWDHSTNDFQIWESVINMLSCCPGITDIKDNGGKFGFSFDDYEQDISNVQHFRQGVFDAARNPKRLSGPEAFELLQRTHYKPTADEAIHIGNVPHTDRVWRIMHGNVIKHWRAGQAKRREIQ